MTDIISLFQQYGNLITLGTILALIAGLMIDKLTQSKPAPVQDQALVGSLDFIRMFRGSEVFKWIESNIEQDKERIDGLTSRIEGGIPFMDFRLTDIQTLSFDEKAAREKSASMIIENVKKQLSPIMGILGELVDYDKSLRTSIGQELELTGTSPVPEPELKPSFVPLSKPVVASLEEVRQQKEAMAGN